MTADVHVVPLQDLRDHVDSRGCWCQPRIEVEHAPFCPSIDADGYGLCWCRRAVVIVHNSLDGRELIEQHGVN